MKSRPIEPGSDSAQLADFLRKGMDQPGVAELMDVYDSWRKYEEPTRAYDRLKTARQTSSLSNSSSLLRSPYTNFVSGLALNPD